MYTVFNTRTSISIHNTFIHADEYTSTEINWMTLKTCMTNWQFVKLTDGHIFYVLLRLRLPCIYCCGIVDAVVVLSKFHGNLAVACHNNSHFSLLLLLYFTHSCLEYGLIPRSSILCSGDNKKKHRIPRRTTKIQKRLNMKNNWLILLLGFSLQLRRLSYVISFRTTVSLTSNQ